MSGTRGRLRPRKAGKLQIKHVQSGIGLSNYDKRTGNQESSFLTSRTARVLLAGAGFLADAYDLFVINLVLRLLRDEYPEYANSGRLHMLEGSVASAALVGSILGQIVAGSLADIVGRKKIFVVTAGLIAIGSFGSACCIDTPFLTIYGQISCWRLFLGCGVGGEYPLAATVTSESTSAGKRGSLMAAVFAMQGIGSLLSGIIVFSCLSFGFSTAFTWRFSLAFGAIPALIAFPYRLRMHETESFERLKKERLHDSLLISASQNPNEFVEKNPITYHLDGDAPVTTVQYDELFPLTQESSKSKILSESLVESNSKEEIEISESEEDDPPIRNQTLITEETSLIPDDHHFNTVATATMEVIFEKPTLPSTETTPLLSFDNVNRKDSHSIDSNDYGQHYELNSRNNSNTEYLQNHLNRRAEDYKTFDSSTNANTNLNRGNFHNNPLPAHFPLKDGGPFIPGGGATQPPPAPVSQSTIKGTHFIPLIHHPLHKSRCSELYKAFVYYRWHLLGTALSWFLLDVDFYANGLFNHEVTSTILTNVDTTEGTITQTTAKQDAINSMIISTIAIPGYILSVFYIEKVGRKNIQMMGFTVMAILFALCGYGYDDLLGEESGVMGKYLFLLIYSCTFLFSNFGPNTTSFVIPGEIYPAEVRATCHGFSAASGKLGAATGAYFFPLIIGPQGSAHPTRDGMMSAMYICSLVAIVGLIVTYIFIPRYDGEMLESINETGNNYLKLEHPCLWPSKNALDRLEEENRRYHAYYNPVGGLSNQTSANSSFEMLQVIRASDDYAMNNDIEMPKTTASNAVTAAMEKTSRLKRNKIQEEGR